MLINPATYVVDGLIVPRGRSLPHRNRHPIRPGKGNLRIGPTRKYPR